MERMCINRMDMKKNYRINFVAAVILILLLLLAILDIKEFIDCLINTNQKGNRLLGAIITGGLGLYLLYYVILGILAASDKFTITDDRIIFRLHRLTSPYSFHAIKEEILWKDIRDSFVISEKKIDFLVIEFKSGKSKKFGISHLNRELPWDIQAHIHPNTKPDEEEQELDRDRYEILKRGYYKLLLYALAEGIAAILFLLENRKAGVIIAFSVLFLAYLPLSDSYSYNSMFYDRALARKAKRMAIQGGVILVIMFAVAMVAADSTATIRS